MNTFKPRVLFISASLGYICMLEWL